MIEYEVRRIAVSLFRCCNILDAVEARVSHSTTNSHHHLTLHALHGLPVQPYALPTHLLPRHLKEKLILEHCIGALHNS